METGRGNTMRSKNKITQDEVSVAMYQFMKCGGHIQKLPDQNYCAAHPIGEDKYEAYESLSALDSLISPNDTVS